ncbi:MAG: chorismate lyase [Gammaproteobacteria bacterium]|jgi:chorismate--pyruvate lyase|nr:chorismate lyase [Gammaproteobacteria bacterium]
MTLGKARSVELIQWLPTERLGQATVDSHVRPWLIGKGLLTLRMKAACGGRFALHLVDQWTGLLDAAHKSALRLPDNAGLFRDVEMCCGGQVWVFEQSIMPDSTLCAHPWLAELGDSALGETLSDLSGIERSSYEYAWLPVDEPVTARALRNAEVKPAGLWARRSRVSIRSAPLLMQELFLPAMGRV